MTIRKAYKEDLIKIMKMYESCVAGMIKNGIDQWDDTYPDTQTIAQDLENQTYYVAEDKEVIVGGINSKKTNVKLNNTFCLIEKVPSIRKCLKSIYKIINS